MSPDLPERRTYDVLRLLRTHEPVGSVKLTERLRERGYSVTERTVRLTLADLDDRGLTEKVGGKGRRLTDAGRSELDRGGVWGRSDHVNERLAELTSRVDYDPETDRGSVVVGTVDVPRSDRDALATVIEDLDRSPLGPIGVSVETVEGVEAGGGIGVGRGIEGVETADDGPVPDEGGGEAGVLRVAAASSVTVNGVLLAAGIDADLEALGVVEYHAEPDTVPYDDSEAADHGGAVLRYTDAIGNERATFDVASVLIGAGRTDVDAALAGERGLLVADYLEYPIARHDEGRDLAVWMRDRLGGAIDVRRPREPGPFPWGTSSWAFASMTGVGAAECLLACCVERGIAADWETLAGVRDRGSLVSATDVVLP